MIGIATDKFKRSFLYRSPTRLYFGLCRIFLPRTQVYGATHFMALTRTALNALPTIKDSFRYIRVLAMYAGFEVTKVPYDFTIRRIPRATPGSRCFENAGSHDRLELGPASSDRRIVCALMGIADFAFLFYIVAARILFTGHRSRAGRRPTSSTPSCSDCIFLVLAVICEYLAELRSEVETAPALRGAGRTAEQRDAGQCRDAQRGRARGPRGDCSR